MLAPHPASFLFPVAALLASSSAGAGTIVVAKNGPIGTIQAGVAAAGAGDTVLVKAGVYRENVVIDGLDGLTLRAIGKVAIDARPTGGAGMGPGIRVLDSDGVTIVGFEVRNAADAPGGMPKGHGIECVGDQITIKDCVAIACTTAGIHVTGDGARISDCLASSSYEGIVLVGNGAKVTRSEIRLCNQAGIDVLGHQAALERCTVHGIKGGYGIVVEGDAAEIEKCAVKNTASDGLRVVGDSARITRNKLELTSYGVSASGSDNVIDRNDIRKAFGAGIDSTGANPTITHNDVDEAAFNHQGIFVFGASTGGLLEDNSVSHASYVGIQVTSNCSGLVVRGNRVRFSGYGHDAGFNISGDQHVFEDNEALKNGGDGFTIFGSDVVLRGNRAVGNGGDGFDLDDATADNVTLDGNVAKGNGAEGIENNGTNAIITGNVAEKNRIDLANDGTIATFSANAFATGGTATAPEID